jgi:hypothetical protein
MTVFASGLQLLARHFSARLPSRHHSMRLSPLLRSPLPALATLVAATTLAFAQQPAEWRSQVDVVAEGDSLEALVQKVKPTFAWGAGDMVWVKEPEPGKVQFTVNRAMRPPGANQWMVLNPKPSVGLASIFDGAPLAETVDVTPASSPTTDEARTARSSASMFETDPELGTLYRVRWSFAPARGREGFTQQRDLFLLRRGDRWRFVGEGATDAAGRLEPGTWLTEGTQYRVDWPARDDKPVAISLSHWRQLAEDADVPTRGDLVTRRDGTIDSSTRVVRFDPREYVLAQAGDTLDAISERLTGWSARGEWKKQPDRRAAMTQKVRPLLASLNQEFAATAVIPAGTRLMIPTSAEIEAALKPTGDAPTRP